MRRAPERRSVSGRTRRRIGGLAVQARVGASRLVGDVAGGRLWTVVDAMTRGQSNDAFACRDAKKAMRAMRAMSVTSAKLAGRRGGRRQNVKTKLLVHEKQTL